MYKILLVCMAGMSTNVMRGKIEDQAKKENVELQVKAVGLDTLEGNLNHVSVVLLAPQVKYAQAMVKQSIDKFSPTTKIMVIKPQDFGMMRGDIVFQQMMELINS